ncbi:MAG: hypothetical protein R8M11_08525 [Gallionella sp.]
MNKISLLGSFLAAIVMLGITSHSYAVGERLIMNMTEKRMNRQNLIHIRFENANGKILSSKVIHKMVIREQDCDAGPILDITQDYKVGFSTSGMQVGVYMVAKSWRDHALCFSVPSIGSVQQRFDPESNQSRDFTVTIE